MLDELNAFSYSAVVRLDKAEYYSLITTLANTYTMTARGITKRIRKIIEKMIPEKILRIENYVHARRELPLKRLVNGNSVHLMDVTTVSNRTYEIHIYNVRLDEDKKFVLYVFAVRK